MIGDSYILAQSVCIFDANLEIFDLFLICLVSY